MACTTIVFLALASLASAIPAPQLEDYATLSQAESSGPAVTVLSQPVTYTPTRTAYETVVAATSAAADSSAAKRQVNNACAPQPSSSNPPMGAQNDTPADFETDPILGDTSINAAVPNGYTQSFSNLNASVSAPGYLGLYLLDSYGLYNFLLVLAQYQTLSILQIPRRAQRTVTVS